MGLTALVSSQSSMSAPLFNDGKPGIRAIQKWMKEAWESGEDYLQENNPQTLTNPSLWTGYDPQGNKDFKGVIMGTKKWIGTAGQSSFRESHCCYCTLIELFLCQICMPWRRTGAFGKSVSSFRFATAPDITTLVANYVRSACRITGIITQVQDPVTSQLSSLGDRRWTSNSTHASRLDAFRRDVLCMSVRNTHWLSQ